MTLDDEIENLRGLMVGLAMKTSLTDPQVVAVSQSLDKLIIKKLGEMNHDKRKQSEYRIH